MSSAQPSEANALDILTFPITSSSGIENLHQALSDDTFFNYFDEVFAGLVIGDQPPSTPPVDDLYEKFSETISKLGNDKVEALTLIEAVENYRRMLGKSDARNDGTLARDLERCSTYQYLLHGLSQRFSDLAQLMKHLAREGKDLDESLSRLICKNVYEARKWLEMLREGVFEF